MALESKIEAVKKVTEALKQDPKPPVHEELERVSPNKEHFQSLFDSANKPLNFQKVEGSYIVAPEGIENQQQNPILAEEHVSAQKSGTATDQENKKRRQSQSEEIEGIGQTNKGSSSSSPQSLMDEVKKLNSQVAGTGRLTPEDLKNQAQGLIAQLENVKSQLSTQTDIKPSYQNVLRNRLTHIDDTLKIALSKAGVEYKAPQKTAVTGTVNPIERFIGYLRNSQYQLEHLSQTIDQLNLTKAELTPANMLAIQIKVGYIQQQIELFTSLLNKALESTKTIMNVQV
jgi:hypothetical protein